MKGSFYAAVRRVTSAGAEVRLRKKHWDEGGEVDYKTKAAIAWSHSYLNQKPRHPPLPKPAPQVDRRANPRQSPAPRRGGRSRGLSSLSPPRPQYISLPRSRRSSVRLLSSPRMRRRRSAKASEVADERKKLDQNSAARDPTSHTDTRPDKNHCGGDKKARPKDVFGRPLPAEEQFEVLKNAPRLETCVPARIKPFGIEIRNVIMPNEGIRDSAEEG